MQILVINCGSSSVKYDLFNVGKERSYCKGTVERIGEDSPRLIHEVAGKGKVERKVACLDHFRAIKIIKEVLTAPDTGVISDINEVMGIGHRVVHGGEGFAESTLIDNKVLDSIKEFSELAPLHNPPALEGIEGCMKMFNCAPQVAVFDTAFHQTMEKHVYMYGVPYTYYEKYGIRKYGFHGTSHRYVAEKAAEKLKKPLEKINVITAHLGNGCSITAIKNGKSVDTSMGFTPLEGLLMGTRSGDLDPALVTFLMYHEKLRVGRMEDLLNRDSGILGVSGISNDMRDILKAIKKGEKRAKLAYDMFVYRIKKYVGAYAAVLGKVDAVVFTAGIGENVPGIKNSIKKDLKHILGLKTKYLIIPTNEELLIAKDTYRIVKEVATPGV